MRLHNLILTITIIGSILSAGIYSIVWGAEKWENGIYAGQHFKNARSTALTALLTQVGPGATSASITEGKPNVKNTRLLGKFGGPQIRIFRFRVNGKLFCVTTWNSGENATVKPGCHT